MYNQIQQFNNLSLRQSTFLSTFELKNPMKKIITSFCFVLASATLFAQKDSSESLNGMFKKANSLFGKKSSSGNSSSNLSSSEIVSGLKEALSLGAQKKRR